MLQSSPTYEYFTRIYPPDTTSARLLVHLLYNSRAFAGWNNVAVVHQDDAWGKGYVTEMELELRRINSKIPLREPDREPGTLLPFAITHTDSDSVKRALDAVNSSGYSVIVVVGHFLPPFSSTFEDFLEACLATPTPRPRLRLSPHLCDCAAQPGCTLRRAEGTDEQRPGAVLRQANMNHHAHSGSPYTRLFLQRPCMCV